MVFASHFGLVGLSISEIKSSLSDISESANSFVNQILKDFEEAKNFRLMLQEVNQTIPGKVIYES